VARRFVARPDCIDGLGAFLATFEVGVAKYMHDTKEKTSSVTQIISRLVTCRCHKRVTFVL